MSKLALNSAVISLPVASGEDHASQRGFFVVPSGSSVALASDALTAPLGVIVDGGASATGEPDSVAICGGGAGVVRVKCAASPGVIAAGANLVLDATTLGAVKADPGTGARVVVARALESGAAGALIDAILVHPIIYAS